MKEKNNMNKVWIKHHKVIGILLMMLGIIPFVLISFYSRPCVDDYGYSYSVYHLVQGGDWNIFSLIKEAFVTDMNFYRWWQGLYTSAFVLALQPGIFGERFYFIGAIALIVFIYMTSTYVSKTIFRILSIDTNPFYAGLFVITIFLQGIPSTIQGIYWFNGAWNYVPFFFLAFVNVAFVLNYFRFNQCRYIIFSIILSFLISGGNHVTSFLNIMFLILCVAYSVCKKKWWTFLPFLSAVIGFMIMYTAPGTAVRQKNYSEQSVLDTLFQSVLKCYELFCEWVDIRWVLCILLMLPVAVLVDAKIEEDLKVNPIFLLGVSIIVFCGELCVPYYAMGNFGEDRVYNIFWMLFMVLSCINVIYFFVWFLQKRNNRKLLREMIPDDFKILVLIVIVGICFNVNSNIWSVSEEIITGNARTFAIANDERYEMIRNAEAGEILVVSPLPDSYNLKFDDITEDIDDWRNSQWYGYYGVRTIVSEEGY